MAWTLILKNAKETLNLVIFVCVGRPHSPSLPAPSSCGNVKPGKHNRSSLPQLYTRKHVGFSPKIKAHPKLSNLIVDHHIPHSYGHKRRALL